MEQTKKKNTNQMSKKMKAKKKKKKSISNVACVPRYQFGNVAHLQRY
jgi:predicted RNA-binding protein